MRDDQKGHLLNPDGTAMTCISMGKLNDEQEAVLRNFVQGFNVHDLGAGQLGMAVKLCELGAHTVTAVDKDYSDYRLNSWNGCEMWSPPLPQITLVGERFAEYAKHGHFIDVAFVCWPECCHQEGLVALIDHARTVVYLGSNFDGMACGAASMWEHLKKREVLALVPSRWNSLIVYSGQKLAGRHSLPEEYAALHREEAYLVYGEDLPSLR